MSTTQSYEDLEAKYEIKETPTSVNFVVHIPEGFAREHVGAKVEHEFSRVKVYGERSLGNNKRERFNALYQLPEYCDINKIKGKFEGKSVIITIATIPGVPRQPTTTTEQEEPPKEPSQDQDTTTPPSDDDNQDQSKEKTDDHEATATTQEEEESMHDQKGQEGIPQNDATLTKVGSEKQVGDHEDEEGSSTSTPPNDTQESIPQKGQEGIPTKDAITKVDSTKAQVSSDHEGSSTSRITQESMPPQKGQEGIPTKDAITKVDSTKTQHEDSSTSRATQKSMPQKGEEGTTTKDAITKVDSKKQVDDHEGSSTSRATQESMPQKGEEASSPNATLTTNSKLQGDENVEKQKQKVVGKEETEDHSKRASESGKPPEKAEVEDSPKKEGNEESKVGLATFEGEKGREIHGKIGNDFVVGKKSDNKKGMHESARARIKEVAASASQAMTSLAKKFNEEDKQRIVYMGAAVLVVALGVYATYKLRSRRP